MITSEETRRGKLLSVGVPAKFLDALDNSLDFDDLELIARYPESSYFYLPEIQKHYSSISDYEITPIFEGVNGDIFSVMLTKGKEVRFVSFELENDEIYEDFGDSFPLMHANLMIELYEVSESSLAELIKCGERMGCEKSMELFNGLSLADSNRERETFEKDREWRSTSLMKIYANES